MKRIMSPFIFLLSACITLTSLSGCGTSDDELILRSNIEQMRNAVSQHQPDKFMAFVAGTYKSPFHRDKRTLEKFVNYHLKQNRVIYIYIADIDVEIDDDNAKIIFYSGITGGPEQIPERGQLYKVGMRWSKTNGQWLLTQAKWRPALVLKKK
ncbi:MAG: hypothetical protein KAT25_05550 [Sulfuriflexus sp.]|nr:hypothetical protein [Sulfuriflexus sp.]